VTAVRHHSFRNLRLTTHPPYGVGAKAVAYPFCLALSGREGRGHFGDDAIEIGVAKPSSNRTSKSGR